jgi:hypothetical protein
MSKPQEKSLGEKLQSVDRRILYVILIVATSIALFFPIEIPISAPDASSEAAYVKLMEAPTDQTAIIQSNWTLSTRGENAGQLEATLRIFMRRGIKFVLFSWADPQAVEVAKNVIAQVNAERIVAGREPYQEFNDFIVLGLYPDLENLAQAMRQDLQGAWGPRRAVDPGTGEDRSVYESPVLQGVRTLEDIGIYVDITANASGDVLIQRIAGDVELVSMCTGVVGPQLLPYYQSGQLKGVVIGLKGVYELEYMMEYYENEELGIVPWTEEARGEPYENFSRGQQYYGALHVNLIIMVLAVIVGNIGLALTKKKGRRNA